MSGFNNVQSYVSELNICFHTFTDCAIIKLEKINFLHITGTLCRNPALAVKSPLRCYTVNPFKPGGKKKENNAISFYRMRRI